MNMTPRLKKLLIVAGIVSMFAVVWTWVILPKINPTVACVYQTPDGEFVKAWGNECNRKDNAIVLRSN